MHTNVAAAAVRSYHSEAVQRGLEEAMALLGGWSAFVAAGERILIKPNLLEALPPEKAATTHPEVLRAVIRGVKSCGAIPSVGDSPGVQSTRKVAQTSGLLAVCREENVPLLPFARAVSFACPDGSIVKRLRLAEELRQTDKVISLAKMKTHAFMGVTGAVKNLFGCFVGSDKAQFHLRMQKHADFAKMIVDLYTVVRPALSIVDGIVGMEGGGPRNGDPIACGLLLAGADGFAVDLIMADRMGFAAEQLPIAAAAIAAGRSPRLRDIAVSGSGKDRRFSFKRPPSYASLRDTRLPNWLIDLGRSQLTARPVIGENCVACGRCAAHCPPGAIAMTENRAVIDDNACIRCYCCQELCPADAVQLRDGTLLRFGKRLRQTLRRQQTKGADPS